MTNKNQSGLIKRVSARFWRLFQPRVKQFPYRSLLVNERHQFIYCPIPKVACTTMKYWFLDTLDIDFEKHQSTYETIHEYCLEEFGLHNYKPHKAKRLIDTYFTFAFVRNPFDRLLSAYNSKFVAMYVATETNSAACDVIRYVYERSHDISPDYDRGISFNEFVWYVVQKKDRELDLHWRPQNSFVSGLRIDFVGRLESLAADIQIVQDHVGKSSVLGWFKDFSTRGNKGVLGSDACYKNRPAGELRANRIYPSKSQVYDPKLRELVYQRFYEDFRMFGYSFYEDS